MVAGRVAGRPASKASGRCNVGRLESDIWFVSLNVDGGAGAAEHRSARGRPLAWVLRRAAFAEGRGRRSPARLRGAGAGAGGFSRPPRG